MNARTNARRIACLSILSVVLASACAEGSTEPTHASGTVVAPSAVVVGDGFSCALDAHGTAYCWGSNAQGQLGDGTTTDRAMAAPVTGGHTFTDIAAGYETACGLTTARSIVCWGAGTFGQLGNGTAGAAAPVPVNVAGTTQFMAVAVGGSFACGLAIDGEAWCWGDNSRRSVGVLGKGDTVSSTIPRRVVGGFRFTSLSAGLQHVCGLDADGVGYCWGANTAFQMGNYQFALFVPGPGRVATDLRFRSIAAGAISTCGITGDGAVHCWGTDEVGVMGLGFHVEAGTVRIRPTPVVGGRRFASMALSNGNTRYGATCGVSTDAVAFCWGSNAAGTLGVTSALPLCSGGEPSVTRASCSDTPLAVSTSAWFRRIVTSGSHSCGITADERLMCWGRNASGELGDGTRSSRAVPALVQ
ncbi:MAG: RCC1 domain-containing protein [Gemmatirosa sp.]